MTNPRPQGQSDAAPYRGRGPSERTVEGVENMSGEQCPEEEEQAGAVPDVGRDGPGEGSKENEGVNKDQEEEMALGGGKVKQQTEELPETRYELNPQAAEWPASELRCGEERPDVWTDIQEVLYSCGADED